MGFEDVLVKYRFEKKEDYEGGSFLYVCQFGDVEISVSKCGCIFNIFYYIKDGCRHISVKNIKVETDEQLDFLLKNGSVGFYLKHNMLKSSSNS